MTMRHWLDDARRNDGLTVEEHTGGIGWAIVPASGAPRITMCPCCGRQFPTAGVARRVADKVFPLPRSAGDASAA
jgi:hypothetical protein